MRIEASRYLAVTLAGAAADAGLAWAALEAGLPMHAALAVGLGTALCMTYVGHEAWSFRSAVRRPSHRRFMGYLCSCALTYSLRLAVLHSIGTHLPLGVRLACAYAVSFVAGYALARLVVFHAADYRKC